MNARSVRKLLSVVLVFALLATGITVKGSTADAKSKTKTLKIKLNAGYKWSDWLYRPKEKGGETKLNGKKYSYIKFYKASKVKVTSNSNKKVATVKNNDNDGYVGISGLTPGITTIKFKVTVSTRTQYSNSKNSFVKKGKKQTINYKVKVTVVDGEKPELSTTEINLVKPAGSFYKTGDAYDEDGEFTEFRYTINNDEIGEYYEIGDWHCFNGTDGEIAFTNDNISDVEVYTSDPNVVVAGSCYDYHEDDDEGLGYRFVATGYGDAVLTVNVKTKYSVGGVKDFEYTIPVHVTEQ